MRSSNVFSPFSKSRCPFVLVRLITLVLVFAALAAEHHRAAAQHGSVVYLICESTCHSSRYTPIIDEYKKKLHARRVPGNGFIANAKVDLIPISWEAPANLSSMLLYARSISGALMATGSGHEARTEPAPGMEYGIILPSKFLYRETTDDICALLVSRFARVIILEMGYFSPPPFVCPPGTHSAMLGRALDHNWEVAPVFRVVVQLADGGYVAGAVAKTETATSSILILASEDDDAAASITVGVKWGLSWSPSSDTAEKIGRRKFQSTSRNEEATAVQTTYMVVPPNADKQEVLREIKAAISRNDVDVVLALGAVSHSLAYKLIGPNATVVASITNGTDNATSSNVTANTTDTDNVAASMSPAPSAREETRSLSLISVGDIHAVHPSSITPVTNQSLYYLGFVDQDWDTVFVPSVIQALELPTREAVELTKTVLRHLQTSVLYHCGHGCSRSKATVMFTTVVTELQQNKVAILMNQDVNVPTQLLPHDGTFSGTTGDRQTSPSSPQGDDDATSSSQEVSFDKFYHVLTPEASKISLGADLSDVDAYVSENLKYGENFFAELAPVFIPSAFGLSPKTYAYDATSTSMRQLRYMLYPNRDISALEELPMYNVRTGLLHMLPLFPSSVNSTASYAEAEASSTSASSLQHNMPSYAALTPFRNKIYVHGGITRDGAASADVSTLELNEFFTGFLHEVIWHPTLTNERSPLPRWDHAMAANGTDTLVILGGISENTATLLNDIWSFDPDNDRWRHVPVSIVSTGDTTALPRWRGIVAQSTSGEREIRGVFDSRWMIIVGGFRSDGSSAGVHFFGLTSLKWIGIGPYDGQHQERVATCFVDTPSELIVITKASAPAGSSQVRRGTTGGDAAAAGSGTLDSTDSTAGIPQFLTFRYATQSWAAMTPNQHKDYAEANTSRTASLSCAERLGAYDPHQLRCPAIPFQDFTANQGTFYATLLASTDTKKGMRLTTLWVFLRHCRELFEQNRILYGHRCKQCESGQIAVSYMSCASCGAQTQGSLPYQWQEDVCATGISALTLVVCFMLNIVTPPAVYLISSSIRAVKERKRNEQAAIASVQAIAELHFGKVAYLERKRSPTRIESAMVTLGKHLKAYKEYLTPPVLRIIQGNVPVYHATERLLVRGGHHVLPHDHAQGEGSERDELYTPRGIGAASATSFFHNRKQQQRLSQVTSSSAFSSSFFESGGSARFGQHRHHRPHRRHSDEAFTRALLDPSADEQMREIQRSSLHFTSSSRPFGKATRRRRYSGGSVASSDYFGMEMEERRTSFVSSTAPSSASEDRFSIPSHDTSTSGAPHSQKSSKYLVLDSNKEGTHGAVSGLSYPTDRQEDGGSSLQAEIGASSAATTPPSPLLQHPQDDTDIFEAHLTANETRSIRIMRSLQCCMHPTQGAVVVINVVGMHRWLASASGANGSGTAFGAHRQKQQKQQKLLAHRIARYYDFVNETVHRFGGVIEETLGDKLVISWLASSGSSSSAKPRSGSTSNAETPANSDDEKRSIDTDGESSQASESINSGRKRHKTRVGAKGHSGSKLYDWTHLTTACRTARVLTSGRVTGSLGLRVVAGVAAGPMAVGIVGYENFRHSHFNSTATHEALGLCRIASHTMSCDTLIRHEWGKYIDAKRIKLRIAGVARAGDRLLPIPASRHKAIVPSPNTEEETASAKALRDWSMKEVGGTKENSDGEELAFGATPSESGDAGTDSSSGYASVRSTFTVFQEEQQQKQQPPSHAFSTRRNSADHPLRSTSHRRHRHLHRRDSNEGLSTFYCSGKPVAAFELPYHRRMLVSELICKGDREWSLWFNPGANAPSPYGSITHSLSAVESPGDSVTAAGIRSFAVASPSDDSPKNSAPGSPGHVSRSLAPKQDQDDNSSGTPDAVAVPMMPPLKTFNRVCKLVFLKDLGAARKVPLEGLPQTFVNLVRSILEEEALPEDEHPI